MSMERSRILDLYKKEIITLEEAMELLEAMDMEMPEEEIRQEDKERRDASDRAKRLSETIREGTDKIFASTREFLNNEKVRSATEKTAHTVKDVCSTIFSAISDEVKTIYNSAKKSMEALDVEIIPSEDGQIHISAFGGESKDNQQLLQQEVLQLDSNKVRISDRNISSMGGITLTEDAYRLVVAVPEGIELELTRTKAGRTTLGITPISCVIELSGATSLNGEIVLTDAEIEMSGASKMEVDGLAGNCTIDVSGACSFNAKEAKCSEFRTDCSGACNLAIKSGQIGHCEIEVSGASSAVVSCIIEEGSAEASGASTIHLSKVNGSFSQKVSGVSSISTAAK